MRVLAPQESTRTTRHLALPVCSRNIYIEQLGIIQAAILLFYLVLRDKVSQYLSRESTRTKNNLKFCALFSPRDGSISGQQSIPTNDEHDGCIACVYFWKKNIAVYFFSFVLLAPKSWKQRKCINKCLKDTKMPKKNRG